MVDAIASHRVVWLLHSEYCFMEEVRQDFRIFFEKKSSCRLDHDHAFNRLALNCIGAILCHCEVQTSRASEKCGSRLKGGRFLFHHLPCGLNNIMDFINNCMPARLFQRPVTSSQSHPQTRGQARKLGYAMLCESRKGVSVSSRPVALRSRPDPEDGWERAIWAGGAGQFWRLCTHTRHSSRVHGRDDLVMLQVVVGPSLLFPVAARNSSSFLASSDQCFIPIYCPTKLCSN